MENFFIVPCHRSNGLHSLSASGCSTSPFPPLNDLIHIMQISVIIFHQVNSAQLIGKTESASLIRNKCYPGPRVEAREEGRGLRGMRPLSGDVIGSRYASNGKFRNYYKVLFFS